MERSRPTALARSYAIVAAFVFSIASTSVSAQNRSQASSASRYRHEIVFPLEMRNVSVGVSPTILSSFISARHNGSGRHITMPHVHLMAEQCAWDWGRAGSIGTGWHLSHGRYRYHKDENDGRGGDRVRMRIGQTNVLATLSYHLTLQSRLECYGRLAGGFGISSRHTSRAGDTGDWHGNFIWNGVVGARWFWCRNLGLFFEAGHTSGAVNTGVTFRW